MVLIVDGLSWKRPFLIALSIQLLRSCSVLEFFSLPFAWFVVEDVCFLAGVFCFGNQRGVYRRLPDDSCGMPRVVVTFKEIQLIFGCALLCPPLLELSTPPYFHRFTLSAVYTTHIKSRDASTVPSTHSTQQQSGIPLAYVETLQKFTYQFIE